MSRKIILSLTIAFLAAAAISGSVLAAEGVSDKPGRPFPGLRRFGVRGEILAVDVAAGSFSIHTQRGEDLSFATGERTKFRGAAANLEDLVPGMPAAVLALRQRDGLPLALQVIIHPELDHVRRYGGRVTEIALDGGALTLETPEQGVLTFTVDGQTRFRGAVAGLGDLDPGQIVIVMAAAFDEGSLKALLIYAPERLPNRRFAGEVTTIDLEEKNFTVLTLDGEFLIVDTDGETVFLSRGGAISGLDSLVEGMLVAVWAARLPDGSLLGKHVAVRLQPE